MKFNLIISILLFTILASCSEYKFIDNPKFGDSIDYKDFGFKQFENYNTFYSRRKIGMSAGNQTSYYQHYDINVPKNIKKWLYYGTEFFIEYENGQIISINPEREIKNEKITDWKELVEDADLLSGISDYFKDVYNKRWDYSANTKSGRITKIYFDGHTTIILFNIKKENELEFFNIKNTLKYINSSH
ncbi:MAG: hypothetical protein A3G95_01635 [Flavobacteria bacterium RIFCSPLOWO2_12_FULL_31_7]|nr:MAG: hypothetical protein A3G95_01635 [Flavobacteria bacterium RIFCSPLOWO2_12_FULL_31_7]